MNFPFNRKHFYTFVCILQILLCLSLECSSQSKIQGVITDVDGKGILHANVLLLRPKDSALLKGAVTNAEGRYFFQHLNTGDYILSASFTGFQSAYTSPFHFNGREDKNINSIQLIKLSGELKKVTVQVRKPPFEQKIDRMVINVQSSITSTGSNVLDVLEKSPGVVVDRQNNTIIMSGKEGVVIMINGKANNMPTSALVQMLAGMNANNVEKIELITTPPSNLDAEGNAGFINIVFKTNPDFGTNGSFSLTAGYAKGETAAAGINVNHRKGKINLYADYTFSRTNLIQNFQSDRQVVYQNRITENAVSNYRDAVQQNHNARAGLDYQLNKKTVLGGLISSYNNRWSMDADIHSFYTVNKIRDTTITSAIHELNHWQHYMANLYFQHAINLKERLSFDIDYLSYKNNNPTGYFNSFYDGTGNYIYEQRIKSGKLTPIHVYVGKFDYFRQLGKKIDFESGLKYTLSKFNNDVSVLRSHQNDWFFDDDFSARYRLREKIAAAYGSVNVNATKKTNFKLGLRYEYTNSNLGTTKQRNIVDRKYGRLFPSFFITHKLTETSSLGLSYTRRITRPTFNELAPWVIFIDPNTFMSGNAALQPSIANTVKSDYVFHKKLLSIAYTQEDDVIARFQPKVDAATNKQILSSENLDTRKIVTITLAIPLNITQWWTMQFNSIGTWQRQNIIYNGDHISIEQKNYRITSSQNFSLPKEYSIELSGFYQSAALVGYTILKSFGALNLGAQKN